MKKSERFVVIPPGEAPDMTIPGTGRIPAEESVALESGAILFIPASVRTYKSVRSIGQAKSYLGKRGYKLCVRSGERKGVKGHYVRAERRV